MLNAFTATRQPAATERDTTPLHTNKQPQQVLLEAEMFITLHKMKVLYRINITLMVLLFFEGKLKGCPEAVTKGKIIKITGSSEGQQGCSVNCSLAVY